MDMNFLRGILISVGISLLICIIMFVYFQRKYSSMETKVNTLFQLVQQEAIKNEQQRNLIIRENTPVVGGKTQSGTVTNQQYNKIEVSDDESDTDCDSDSDDSVVNYDDESGLDSDSDDSDNEESTKNVIINQEEDEQTDVENTIELNVNKINLEIDNVEESDESINVQKTEQDDENNLDIGNKDLENIKYLEENNYQKMPVSRLREVIVELDLPIMGNIQKIKKKELIESIEQYISQNNVQTQSSVNVSELLLEASQSPKNTISIDLDSNHIDEEFSTLIEESVHSQDEDENENDIDNKEIKQIDISEENLDIDDNNDNNENSDEESLLGDLDEGSDTNDEIENLD